CSTELAYAVVSMPTVLFVFVLWFVVWRMIRTNSAPGGKECFLLGLLIGVTAMGVAAILVLMPLVLATLLLKPKIDNGADGRRATWTGEPAGVDEPGGGSISQRPWYRLPLGA